MEAEINEKLRERKNGGVFIYIYIYTCVYVYLSICYIEKTRQGSNMYLVVCVCVAKAKSHKHTDEGNRGKQERHKQARQTRDTEHPSLCTGRALQNKLPIRVCLV